MMDNVPGMLRAMCRGFIDSLKGAYVLFNLDREYSDRMKALPIRPVDRRDSGAKSSPKRNSQKSGESRILNRALQCCAFNGGIFWASILFFEWGVMPFIKYLIIILCGNSSTRAITIWSWTRTFLSLTFGTVWILPLFLISRIINSLWFQDIANCAYKYKQGRPLQIPSVSKIIADVLVSILIQALFLGQGLLVSRIPLPPLNELLELIHMCLLYALYAFEYKWFNMGWELHKRLTFIECNWPYFVGFGMPLAIMTHLPNSYVVSGCVFSILFPLFIVGANEAVPVMSNCNCQIKLFSPVIAIANTLFRKTIGQGRKR